ncbi:MAG: hypothetical protein AB1567_07030 [bacterium]
MIFSIFYVGLEFFSQLKTQSLKRTEFEKGKILNLLTFNNRKIQQTMFFGNKKLTNISSKKNTFDHKFLEKAARKYAILMGGIEPSMKPIGRSFLRDLEGNPTAFVAIFQTGPIDKTLTEQIADELNTQGDAIVRATKERQFDKAILSLKKMRIPEKFTTVMVGASPITPTLVSLSKGLPPQVFMEIGRKNVANKIGKPINNIRVVKPFYEPRMSKGYEIGFLYKEVSSSGKPSTEEVLAEKKYVYLLPSALFPIGITLQEKEYQNLRKSLKDEASKEISKIKGMDPERGASAQGPNGFVANWGRVSKSLGVKDIKEICPNCEEKLITEFKMVSADPNVEIFQFLPHLAESESTDENCTSYYTYINDNRTDVTSCDNLENHCCLENGQEWDPYNCPVSCTTECSETHNSYRTKTYSLTAWYRVITSATVGRSPSKSAWIWGVPTFYQHIAGQCSWPYQNQYYYVGCGPIAGAELVAWYASIGYTGLTDGFRDSNGKLKWQELAETLRDDYMNCTARCAAEGDDNPTSCSGIKVKNGLKDYFDEKGYENWNFSYYKVKAGGEGDKLTPSEGFEKIKTYVDQGYPVIIVYCVDEDQCDGGIGIRDVSLDWTEAHDALITGYYEESGVDYIYINYGHGEGDNYHEEWHIPQGSVRLIFVSPPLGAAFDTSKWCTLENLCSYFTPCDDIDVTLGGENDNNIHVHDDFPLSEDSETIQSCNLENALKDISTTVTYPYTYTETWTDTDRCLTPDDEEYFEDVIEELEGDKSDDIPDQLSPE